jgi:DNA mismatch repair ATPase MutL
MEVMQQLVFDLEKMNPLSFRPHGRPVSIEISKQELEKRFNRPI